MKIVRVNILTLLCFFLLACDNEKKEYYPNGSIKSVFKVSNGKLEGEYRQYYKSGNLEFINHFLDGKKIDSSIYYKDSKDEMIDKIVRHLNDSIQYNLFYNESEGLILEGKSLNEEYREGKWVYYDRDYDSIVEYKNINSTTYSNQVWVIDKNKDTLGIKSNYFSIYCAGKDTIPLNDTFKLSIMLVEPYYNYDSEMEVLIPKIDRELKDDFSNLEEIKLDTLKSLKNDGISNVGIPENVPINHIVEFGLQFEEPGKKKIRGVIVEYFVEDSGMRIERRLFFEKEIVIRGSVLN